MPKILVADPIAREGIAILKEAPGVETDVITGLAPQELLNRIGEYEGLIVRSESKVTAEVIRAGQNLRVIARAGVGVDNIDVEAATAQGVLVVNTPDGNTIAAAELTIGLLLSMARKIAQANATLREGKWDRKSFVGTEVYHKTLGVIGLGRIGSQVARRAQGLDMNVMAFDPFLSGQYAERFGVKLYSLDEVLRASDFITIHTPMTAETRHFIGERELALLPRGARVINVARGGIIDEKALMEALNSGHIAGAALDVFETEPATDNPLIKLPNVVATPHLGASSEEAQIKVAVDAAQMVLAALKGDFVDSAVNLPALPKEALATLKPYFGLAEKMGRLVGSLSVESPSAIEVSLAGEDGGLNRGLIVAAVLKGLLSGQMEEPVSLVNARATATRRGITITERQTNTHSEFTGLVVGVKATNAHGERSVDGTVLTGFGESSPAPRIVRIDGYHVDFPPTGMFIVSSHIDKPGIIGKVGTVLGENNVNIAGMQVGRVAQGGRAVMLLGVDDSINDTIIGKLRQIDGMADVRFIDLGQ